MGVNGYQILKPDEKTENTSSELQKFIHKDSVSYLEAALELVRYAPVQTSKGNYHLQAHFSADLSFVLSNIRTTTVVL